MTEYEKLNENLTQVRLDIRELMTEVRGLKELKNTVDEHETRISKVEDSSKVAHKRLDKIDKLVFWLGTTVVGAVILAVLSLVIIKGGK